MSIYYLLICKNKAKTVDSNLNYENSTVYVCFRLSFDIARSFSHWIILNFDDRFFFIVYLN